MDVTHVSARGAVVAPIDRSPVVFTTEALSLWGGFDPATGLVIDTHHPLCGRSLTGVVLALPAGRGSSTSSAVLLEAVRRRTAPRAFLFHRLDPVFVVGSLVADALYGRPVPMLVVDDDHDFSCLARAHFAAITPDGRLLLDPDEQ